jgi:hypothetical protein
MLGKGGVPHHPPVRLPGHPGAAQGRPQQVHPPLPLPIPTFPVNSIFPGREHSQYIYIFFSTDF